ncbi:MAG: hypothetical protein WCD80_07560 [Desulfobaccales bacterium]
MQRLVPLLILTAFFLDLSGGLVDRLPVKLQLHACTQACPQLTVYPPNDEASSKCDVDEQQLSPPNNFVLFREPSWKSSQPRICLIPTPPKQYCWLGLGCGGLPAQSPLAIFLVRADQSTKLS